MSASDRSNGTSPAPPSSSDTGPTSRDGEMLLPTPRAQDEYERSNRKTVARAMDGEAQMTLTRWVRGHTDPKIQELRVKAGGRNPLEQKPASGSRPLGQGPQLMTSSSADSPASPSAPPAVAKPRTITAGSGPSSPVSFATLDPDGSWLKTYPDSSVQASLLGPPLERFFGTWPRSGSMHAGTVYAHPTLERPTSESGSSYLPTATVGDSRNSRNATAVRQPGSKHHAGTTLSDWTLLHTPTTGDGTPRYDHRASPGYVRNKPVPNLDAQIEELLPTPTADHSRGLAQPGTDSQNLPNTVMDLLPTPRVGGMKNGPSAAEVEAGDPKHRIETAIEVQRLRGDHTNQPSEGGSE